jgi:hypothetical protein
MRSIFAVVAKISVVVICASLIGCAAEIYRTPTQFSPSTREDGRILVIAHNVTVVPTSGFPRTLKAGSTWKHVGRTPQGAVFQIKDDVFVIGGRNRHEANCVISDDHQLVGFFLPVEQAFVPLPSPVQLPINQK